MDKTTVTSSKKRCKSNIFSKQDVPKIRQVIEQITKGSLSQLRAADQYGVTRHQIRKWYELLKEGTSDIKEEEFDVAYRKKVVREFYVKGLRMHDACTKYNLPLDTLRRWLKSMPGMAAFKPGEKITNENRIDDIIKIETAHKVQKEEISQFRAARELKVTRYTIRKWINKYPVANLAGEINFEIMASEEKTKQLEQELERLKKELEREKLKTEGLTILIEVAEEKFGIKIKKKPGSRQQSK